MVGIRPYSKKSEKFESLKNFENHVLKNLHGQKLIQFGIIHFQSSAIGIYVHGHHVEVMF